MTEDIFKDQDDDTGEFVGAQLVCQSVGLSLCILI